MLVLVKLLRHPIAIAGALFIASVMFYGNAALKLPVLFNLDNHYNHAATRYLAEHKTLPVVGTDTEGVVFTELGTTRSLRPPFTYIVSALVAKAAEGIVDNRITRQRLAAPVLGAVTLTIVFFGFHLVFNHSGLALVGVGLIGLLPKFVFLASSNNDDIGAILSASLLFTCVLALTKHGPQKWVLVALAFSFGLILQTKFTAWLTLPWFGFFCVALLARVWRPVLKMAPWLLIVFIVAGAWWPMFNMLNYGVDDPTALNHAQELQRSLGNAEPNRQGYAANGVQVHDLLTNYDQFLSKSYKSLIGYLEWIELEMSAAIYLFYGGLFIIGLIAALYGSRAVHEQSAYLELLILLMVISQCAFYLHHNLIRDIQPQARYILPVITPLVYLFLRALALVPSTTLTVHLRGRIFAFQSTAASALIIATLLVYSANYRNHILPAFQSTAFHTSVSRLKKYPINEVIKVISTDSLSYALVDDRLQLHRTGPGLPTLMLDPVFCELLPINALITFNLSSDTKGGMYLRLDRRNSDTFNSLYWRSFPAGKNVAVFSVNSKDCSGAKITLAKGTHQLIIDSIQISELKIHRHGRPI